MVVDLTFDNIKFIAQQLKSNPVRKNFTKLDVGKHLGFSDSWWDYWVFDTYAELCNAFPDCIATEEPYDNLIPPEEFM